MIEHSLVPSVLQYKNNSHILSAHFYLTVVLPKLETKVTSLQEIINDQNSLHATYYIRGTK